MISSSGLSPPRRARGGPLRVLTTDGEFHSARRQFARWEEERMDRAGAGRRRAFREPLGAVPRARRESGEHDLILVSQVLFNSGRMFDRVDELAALGRPDGSVGRNRRLSRLHGARRAVRRGGCKDRFLSRRRLQICDVGRGLRLPSRALRLRRPAAGHRLVRRVRGFEPAAGKRRLCQGRDGASSARPSIHRALPLQRRAADACRQRPDDGADFRACGGVAGALLDALARHCARPRPSSSIRSTASPRALPRLPQFAARSAGTKRCWPGIASPTCAATCCASALRFITMPRTSTGSPHLLAKLDRA